MSQPLINRSADLARLRKEGYDVEVRGGFLVVKGVPYVNSQRQVCFGTLISELTLAGDQTARPSTHVAFFSGEYPCNADGSEISQIRHQSQRQTLGHGIEVHHSFSSKPSNGYKDYYDKMATYTAILSGPAELVDPNVTARVFPVIESEDPQSVFKYVDTASSRAGIDAVARRLETSKVAIIGLGGTGSYVLDLLAKTPIKEIHLFDGDMFFQHNAFRCPGAFSIDDLRAKKSKVAHFRDLYSKMRHGVVAHEGYLCEENVGRELSGIEFAFVCVDRGGARAMIIDELTRTETPLIDAGMGVYQASDGMLGGILRVTTSSMRSRDHFKHRVPLSDADPGNEYSRNIQIADLNALNAALAVIKWKKLCGFYLDLDHENHATYTINGNCMLNEDHA